MPELFQMLILCKIFVPELPSLPEASDRGTCIWRATHWSLPHTSLCSGTNISTSNSNSTSPQVLFPEQRPARARRIRWATAQAQAQAQDALDGQQYKQLSGKQNDVTWAGRNLGSHIYAFS